MKKVLVATNGCPENRLDCAEIEQFFIDNGWGLSKQADQADVIILNLCGLLNGTEKKSLNIIRQAIRKKRSDAKILVTGCLPKINIESIHNTFHGEIVKGHNIQKISERLGLQMLSGDKLANYLTTLDRFPETFTEKLRRKKKFLFDPYAILNQFHLAKYLKYWNRFDLVQPNTFFIKVSTGCENTCAYCAVKLSRGAVKSKPVEKVVQELKKGLDQGYAQFALVGTDLGSYGADIGVDLICMLKELISLDGNFKLKLRNVHPQYLIRQFTSFLEVIETNKIAHITTAIQHGNDRILEIMHRRYCAEDWKTATNSFKQVSPNIVIRSQLMVGYPSETLSEFNDTLKLMDSAHADFFEIYGYSPRIGTQAAKLPHQLPENIINRRKYIAIKTQMQVLSKIHD
ncbi:MAG: radical SAM protein [Desulfobacteraceae bacterium]|nr:radical SAM protein [Desulfobacteraceae bacterium]